MRAVRTAPEIEVYQSVGPSAPVEVFIQGQAICVTHLL